MRTNEVKEARLTTNTGKIGGIGEDRGGIPIVAALTALMLAVSLFAVGYLFFAAPKPQQHSPQGSVNNRVTLSDGQRGLTPNPQAETRTLDENPMSTNGSVPTTPIK